MVVGKNETFDLLMVIGCSARSALQEFCLMFLNPDLHPGYSCCIPWRLHASFLTS